MLRDVIMVLRRSAGRLVLPPLGVGAGDPLLLRYDVNPEADGWPERISFVAESRTVRQMARKHDNFRGWEHAKG